MLIEFPHGTLTSSDIFFLKGIYTRYLYVRKELLSGRVDYLTPTALFF